MAKKEQKLKTNVSLENVVTTAIQVPGVKVNRELFLREQFQKESKELIESIVENGPVNAQVSQDTLRKMAKKIINERTIVSTGASFVAGLPGGLAMAATIPADMIQFYGVALRMAQELAYLYGEGDLWNGEFLDNDKVTNQLILYCGVMLGASGASQAVRVMSSALAKQILKKLPQKALTKTFYYPIVKGICKFFGVSMTKNLFAKGISKAVPILGGVVSGGITFATLRPMGQRLADTLDEAHFSYTEEEFQEDWENIVEISEEENALQDSRRKVDAETNVLNALMSEAQSLRDKMGFLTESVAKISQEKQDAEQKVAEIRKNISELEERIERIAACGDMAEKEEMLSREQEAYQVLRDACDDLRHEHTELVNARFEQQKLVNEFKNRWQRI